MNKYQDNEQFKVYQSMLKCIIVKSSEKKQQANQKEKENNREPRRKLDFDTDEEFLQE